MENAPKRRGRKPKNLNRIIEPKVNNTIAPIITHLPIDISDNCSDSDIFVKDDEKDKRILELETQVKNLKSKIRKKSVENKCTVYEVNYNTDTVCWWCKHPFVCPQVELPTKYHDDTFYTFGKFCSYECCEAYNIDMNDDGVYKRSSLLKYHYYKTYGKFKNINKAMDWKVLKAFGGNVHIDDYRKLFETNDSDYNYLKPPMISRYAQIEKINLIKDNIVNNDLILKRSKPLKNNNNLKKFIKSENT